MNIKTNMTTTTKAQIRRRRTIFLRNSKFINITRRYRLDTTNNNNVYRHIRVMFCAMRIAVNVRGSRLVRNNRPVRQLRHAGVTIANCNMSLRLKIRNRYVFRITRTVSRGSGNVYITFYIRSTLRYANTIITITRSRGFHRKAASSLFVHVGPLDHLQQRLPYRREQR